MNKKYLYSIDKEKFEKQESLTENFLGLVLLTTSLSLWKNISLSAYFATFESVISNVEVLKKVAAKDLEEIKKYGFLYFLLSNEKIRKGIISVFEHITYIPFIQKINVKKLLNISNCKEETIEENEEDILNFLKGSSEKTEGDEKDTKETTDTSTEEKDKSEKEKEVIKESENVKKDKKEETITIMGKEVNVEDISLNLRCAIFNIIKNSAPLILFVYTYFIILKKHKSSDIKEIISDDNKIEDFIEKEVNTLAIDITTSISKQKPVNFEGNIITITKFGIPVSCLFSKFSEQFVSFFFTEEEVEQLKDQIKNAVEDKTETIKQFMEIQREEMFKDEKLKNKIEKMMYINCYKRCSKIDKKKSIEQQEQEEKKLQITRFNCYLSFTGDKEEAKQMIENEKEIFQKLAKKYRTANRKKKK